MKNIIKKLQKSGCHGYNIKRLREILSVKQNTLAEELNISQQAVSEMEKRTIVSDEMMEKVAKALVIPMDVIKNFNDEVAINTISNLFTNCFHHNSSSKNQPEFNQQDERLKAAEQLLKAEREINALLKLQLAKKKK